MENQKITDYHRSKQKRKNREQNTSMTNWKKKGKNGRPKAITPIITLSGNRPDGPIKHCDCGFPGGPVV